MRGWGPVGFIGMSPWCDHLHRGLFVCGMVLSTAKRALKGTVRRLGLRFAKQNNRPAIPPAAEPWALRLSKNNIQTPGKRCLTDRPTCFCIQPFSSGSSISKITLLGNAVETLSLDIFVVEE
jgi:hypothetical protein